MPARGSRKAAVLGHGPAAQRPGPEVNTIKAANFAHFNDLALLHLASRPERRTFSFFAGSSAASGESKSSDEVLRRHYLPISCQETQASTPEVRVCGEISHPKMRSRSSRCQLHPSHAVFAKMWLPARSASQTSCRNGNPEIEPESQATPRCNVA